MPLMQTAPCLLAHFREWASAVVPTSSSTFSTSTPPRHSFRTRSATELVSMKTWSIPCFFNNDVRSTLRVVASHTRRHHA
jgi:hypothetical protein